MFKRLGLFDREEKFLILNIYPHQMGGVLMGLKDDRSIRIIKKWEQFSIEDLNGRWQKIPRWKPLAESVVAAVHPSLAFTVTIPFHLSRESERNVPLTAFELENILSKAVSQSFVQFREDASRFLKVAGLDTILADSRVSHFKVDNHQVYNPIGFRTETVSAVCEMTFITRELYNSLKFLFKRRKFFFTDIARAHLASLRKIYELPLSLIMLDAPSSWIFTLKPAASGSFLGRKKIFWSSDSFLEDIMSQWGVSYEVAEKIYTAYLKKEISSSMVRLFAPRFKKSMQGLESELKKLRGQMFISSRRPLPFPLRKSGSGTGEIPFSKILEKMGFSVSPGNCSDELGSYFSPFIECFSDQGSPEINRWLHRRLHWLGSIDYNV